jgi:radical SAM superfamily enzyme YgiQ (UPF0313 family)
MSITHIDPLKDLGELLLQVEKPARYTGGEYGILAKRDAGFRTLIAFPDLYEIGMSNQAFRIIYNRLNAIEGISCDRAFAPAPDFETLLRERHIPLYGLDTGIALGGLDLLLFTVGYELGITEVLAMLEASFIPIRSADRGAGDPIVIMGGPCVSNPLPYARFIDAFWIGEAEAGFFSLVEELRDMKRGGAARDVLLEHIWLHPSVWTAGKGRAVRAVDRDFGASERKAAVFPVPSMKAVQHHGAGEIMRGCPNGCRFCHAGFWYRPMRQKDARMVREEAAEFINAGGYRKISLSSLSTGDYLYIDSLMEVLNGEFGKRHVSFQLPSLRVSGFSLPLLGKISAVRKSGLTFAIETPEDAWQISINKEVSRETVAAILSEAKTNGWRGAKFYFMVGLPVGDYLRGYEHNQEEIAIVDFILDLALRTRMHFNINVGTFIPKPHTPYQWVPQIHEAAARDKINYIRNILKPRGHKVRANNPFTALIEGALSRGDERAGDLIEEAYLQGCRFDAWDEFIQKDIWSGVFEAHAPLIREFMEGRDSSMPLPWECIESGIGTSYLIQEYKRSEQKEFTLPCIKNCIYSCNICSSEIRIVENNIQYNNLFNPLSQCDNTKPNKDPTTVRVLFSFKKQGRGVFLSHLALIEVFFMAFTRTSIPVLYSQGFNPLPKLDFASPLSIGISAEAEIATIDLDESDSAVFSTAKFTGKLNSALPEGIIIGDVLRVVIPGGAKKHSVPALLWGFSYMNPDGTEDLVPAGEEKKYRQNVTAITGGIFGLRRKAALAKNPQEPEKPESYFTVYKRFYP